jgi:hypothetical protein
VIERRQLLKAGLAASIAKPFVGRTGWAATPTHTLVIASSRWRSGRVILMEIPVRMRKNRTRTDQMESLTGLLC